MTNDGVPRCTADHMKEVYPHFCTVCLKRHPEDIKWYFYEKEFEGTICRFFYCEAGKHIKEYEAKRKKERDKLQ